MLLQQQLQEHVLVPHSVEQMTKALPKAEILIIVLHNGILYDATFAGMVLAAAAAGEDLEGSMSTGPSMVKTFSNSSDIPNAWQKMVTVSADANFTFPGHEFYSLLQAQGVGPGLGQEAGPKLCSAYKMIFKKISLPFSGHASQSLIDHQALGFSESSWL